MAVGSILDPYAALAVPHDASSVTIRSSYKKLMLQCHPDKVRDDAQRAEKAQQFQKVQEAYELLIDSRRRRKYDEELVRGRHSGPAVATSAAGAASSAAGPSAGDEAKQQKDRDRQERRRRRKQDDDVRRSREETSFSEQDREARKAHQATYKAQKTAEREHRYKEEVPKHSSRHTYGSSSSSRYTTDDTPRKSSTYEARPTPHAAPQPEPRAPPPAQPEAEPVRPGYEETRAAEAAKLEAARRRISEVHGPSSGTTRTHRSNSHDEDANTKAQQAQAQMASEQFRIAEQQRLRMEEEQQRRERDRRERKARQSQKEAQEHLSERLGRPTDIPSVARSRKMSSSPLGKRRGSSVSKDDFGTTPPFKPMGANGIFSGSVPTKSFHPGSPPHVGGPGYPHVRRRHSVSSPSLEKQTSRLQRDQQTCDSGYSSPSPNDTTPITFEKKHIPSNLNPNPNPTVRNADGSTIHPRDSQQGTPGWKKYIVYVQEDGNTSAVPLGSPSAHRRKTSSAGGTKQNSPESQHAEPIISEGPPLPPDFFAKAAGAGIGSGGTFFVQTVGGGMPVDARGYAIPHAANYATSTTSHSSHSSPRQPPMRHHSVHHQAHQSPKMGSEPVFGSMPSPGMSRASMYSTSTRRTDMHYAHHGGGFVPTPPAFARNGTWS